MPQTYAKLGQSIGDMLGDYANGNAGAYNKGTLDRSTLDMHRAAAAKTQEETKQLQQFNDPAQVKRLALMMSGGSEADLPSLDAFQKSGGIGDGVFQKPSADLEMLKPVQQGPVMLSDPAVLASPGANSLGDLLTTHAPQGRTLPLAVPDNIRAASRLAAFLQAGGDKMATPEFYRQMRDDPAIQAAAASGDTDLLNRLNAAAKGVMYTPYRSDDNGRTTNEGSGSVEVTDAGLHDTSIGKLVADAIQSRARAVESNAQAAKHKFDTDNPKANDKYKAVRDDIRSDFNAMYPISSLNGKRPTNAPDFNDFTKSWLGKFNINEADYFNGSSPAASPTVAPVTATSIPAKNANGWMLHTDAKGNRAYVSPDGKQYEEVK